MSVTDTDRRGGDRRGLAERRRAAALVEFERRMGDRRSGKDRRLLLQSAGDQIHVALKLLTRIAESGLVIDQERRNLEAAMLRLRFALERLEP
jgi:hypothetical protein